MLKLTESKKLLKHLIATLPFQQEISVKYNNETEVFFNHLISLSRFTNHANASYFIVKQLRGYQGKRYKGLCLITANSGYHMPITHASLSNKKTKANPRAKVLAAMRLAIEEQIKYFKQVEKERAWKERKPLRCGLTKKPLLGCAIHVDHIVPFSKLADDFLLKNKLKSFSEIKLNRNVLSKEWHDKWYDYHAKHATLQLVSAKANIKASAKGYKSKF